MNLKQLSEDEIFNVARKIQPVDARDSYLEQACGGNPAVRDRVEVLLNAYTDDDSFLEGQAIGIATSAIEDETNSELIQSTIGPYKLLEPIGEGGMGTVYMADQAKPVRRRVAIKLIKPGMDSKQVIARFDAERQALAMMDHPNIAKVFDAGTTESGRPYFVMELVKGLPITEFCDQQNLSTDTRLKLFRQICQAVQHAHQKGIIHRDLKPSNILIAMYDDVPVPKVIDFGVAKATSEPLSENTFFTRFGEVVGTLAYMSPEQAQFNQLDIDTRSDIYSLGSILYELLVGEPPFDKERLKSQAFDETLRMIREEEPTKPSTKLGSAEHRAKYANTRNTTSEKLASTVSGELDWIVMKSLEKDRSRRYETANEFASDIERYLKDEPVSAGPPSAAYRFRKFARRNSGKLIAVSMIAFLLVTGIGVSTWQAIRATRAVQVALDSEQAAKTEAAISKAVIDFINEDLLAKASTHAEPNRNIEVRELLDRVAFMIGKRFTDQPLVEMQIRKTVGWVYNSLGEYEKAEAHFKRAIQISDHELGSQHRVSIENLLARHAVQMGSAENYQPICTGFENIVATCKSQFGEEDELTLRSRRNLANAYRALGQLDFAEGELVDVIAIGTKSYGAEYSGNTEAKQILATVYGLMGRFREAEALHRENYQWARLELGPAHPFTLACKQAIGNLCYLQGQYVKAEEIFKEILPLMRQHLGVNHPAILILSNDLANALYFQNKLNESSEIQRELIKLKEKKLGPEHPSILDSRQNLAGCLFSAGRFSESEDAFKDVLEVRQRTQAPDHRYIVTAMTGLASCMVGLGRYDEAESLTREAYIKGQHANWGNYPYRLSVAETMAEVLLKQGKYVEAESICRKSIGDANGAVSHSELGCQRLLATAQCFSGKYVESVDLARKVYESSRLASGEANPDTLFAAHVLAMAIHGAGRNAEAETEFQKVLKLRQEILGNEHPDTLETMNYLATAISAQGRFEEAETIRMNTLELRRNVLGKNHPETLATMVDLASDYLASQQFAESEKYCREVLDSEQTELSKTHPTINKCMRCLADVLQQQGRIDEAKQIRQELLEVERS